MQYWILVILVMPMLGYADDWLGDTRAGYSMGLRFGLDNNSESLIGFDATLPLPKYSQLLLNYSVAEPSDDEFSLELESYAIFFASDPLANWAFDIGYQYRGDTHLIEVSDREVGLQYFPGSWLAKIRYLNGDVEVFLRSDRDASATTDREGYGLTLDRYWKKLGFSLAGTDYDYAADLSRLNSFFLSLFRVNDIRDISVINFGVIDQVFNLPDWEWAAELNYSTTKNYWRFGYQEYQSAVDKAQFESVYAGFNMDISNRWQLGLLFDISLDESDLYSEASLRVNW